MQPIQLIEIEPNSGRFRTQLSNDKSVASFALINDTMHVWGGYGQWIEFKESYTIVDKIIKQPL
jgi:hypothetical protein